MKKNLSLILLYLFTAGIVYGQSTITFDDLSARGFTISVPPTYVPNGYQGLNWSNFAVANTTGFPLSGLLNGTVSASNVVGSIVIEGQAQTATISGNIPFVIVSGYFTAAFLNEMSLEVTGMNGANKKFDQTFLLNATGPSFLAFPAFSVTEVDFLASGGVSAGQDYMPGGAEFVLDNLTIAPVPEPAGGWFIGLGLGTLVLLRRKRN